MATQAFHLAALITALGTDYKNSLRIKNNSAVTLSAPQTDTVFEYEIQDDNSATASWPNRLAFFFKAFGGSSYLVFWLNEYFEPRVTPAKSNTVALRIFGSPTSGGVHTGALFEIVNDRVNRELRFSVDQDGNVHIQGDLTLIGSLNGFPYHPTYAPGTTPDTSDPTGLVVVTS